MSKFNCFLCHQDMNGDPITKEEIDYIKEKIKSLETKLKEMTYNYQGVMSDCDHYEDVIKKLETKLALRDKQITDGLREIPKLQKYKDFFDLYDTHRNYPPCNACDLGVEEVDCTCADFMIANQELNKAYQEIREIEEME